jgi:hypothetical protein
MGNCISGPERIEKARSDAIDKELKEASEKFKKECKILLLGMCTSFGFVSEDFRVVGARSLRRFFSFGQDGTDRPTLDPGGGVRPSLGAW